MDLAIFHTQKSNAADFYSKIKIPVFSLPSIQSDNGIDVYMFKPVRFIHEFLHVSVYILNHNY